MAIRRELFYQNYSIADKHSFLSTKKKKKFYMCISMAYQNMVQTVNVFIEN